MTGNKKMKYHAYFSANDGSTYNVEPYEYTNKKKAIASIKRIVRANHFQQSYNRSRYSVLDENGIYVAVGALHDCGWWSVDHDIIGTKG